MTKLTKILIVLLLAVLGGFVMFLATSDMPPPSAPVERVIPNDRFGN